MLASEDKPAAWFYADKTAARLLMRLDTGRVIGTVSWSDRGYWIGRSFINPVAYVLMRLRGEACKWHTRIKFTLSGLVVFDEAEDVRAVCQSIELRMMRLR